MASDLIHLRLKSGLTIVTTWQQDLGSYGHVERPWMAKHSNYHTLLLLSARLVGRGTGKKRLNHECHAWIFLSTTSERLIGLLSKSCALLLRLERDRCTSCVLKRWGMSWPVMGINTPLVVSPTCPAASSIWGVLSSCKGHKKATTWAAEGKKPLSSGPEHVSPPGASEADKLCWAGAGVKVDS